MLYSIQILRFFAAICVVLVHSMDELGLPSKGHFGVDIFFVISGFVLTVRFSPVTTQEYFTRRFLRIFPLYLFFSLLFLAVKPFFFPFSFEDEFLFFLRSVFFIPTFTEEIGMAVFYPVGWSLVYEMWFYLALAISAGLGSPTNRFKIMSLSWLCLVVLAQLYEGSWLSFMGSLIFGEFILGMLIALLVSHYPAALQRYRSLSWIVIFVSAAYLFQADHAGMSRFWSYGLMSACLVMAVINVDPFFQKLPRYSKRVMKGLGDVSYSLYLSHPFVLWGAYRILGIDTLSYPLQAILVVGATTMVAFLVWRYLELPFSRVVNNVTGSRRIGQT